MRSPARRARDLPLDEQRRRQPCAGRRVQPVEDRDEDRRTSRSRARSTTRSSAPRASTTTWPAPAGARTTSTRSTTSTSTSTAARSRPQNNINFAYFNNAALNKAMDAAANLSGAARAKAYQKLDYQIMKKYAPWVPYAIVNERVLRRRRGCRTASTRRTSGSRTSTHWRSASAPTTQESGTGGAPSGASPAANPAYFHASIERKETGTVDMAVPDQADLLGDLPVPRRDDHHLRDLLRDPGRSGAARLRPGVHAGRTSPASATSCIWTSRSGSSTSGSSGTSSATRTSAARS